MLVIGTENRTGRPSEFSFDNQNGLFLVGPPLFCIGPDNKILQWRLSSLKPANHCWRMIYILNSSALEIAAKAGLPSLLRQPGFPKRVGSKTDPKIL